ncbi:N-acetyltransferase [Clostridium sp. SHJSY1]|uniref:GNAT family N-acetyltransferase n=1 Tax=Clostridium sp. SHJSY1 TaxID=2942483 RepID=UPI002874CD75|nr:GNAT family N-acetyltransferase [Clostridium sp. SHJSY1]MDS0525404.1 N-acetyltransferase [Clostridium sp. SHJSY1]
MDWKYENGRIYSENEKGELMAEATFDDRKNGEININHVYVNPVLRGKGVANKIMEVVVESLRERGIKATATCSYANSWFKKNEKLYSDVISEDMWNQSVSCKIGGNH